MKFFVPFAKSTKEAISVIRSIGEEHFGNFSPALKQMIYTVQYQHNGKSMVATVGEDVDTYYNESFPTVIAIFPPRHNGAPIRICLKDRGVIRGEPIFVSGTSQFITFDS